jgi:hypothetical protein
VVKRVVLTAAVLGVLGGGVHADEVLRGDVEVWLDAPLRTDPDGETFAVGKIDGGRKAHPGATVAMHVVAVRGKLVEVEPACTSSLRVRGLAHVRFFVARADVAGAGHAPPKCQMPSSSDDGAVAVERDVIPSGAELATPAGHAFAVAAAPLPVTLVRGAKKVCVARDVLLDNAVVGSVRACTPAKAIRHRA